MKQSDEKHADQKDIECRRTPVNQHLVDDHLGKQRCRQSKELNQQGNNQYLAQKMLVFADDRHQPRQTKLDFAFFFQLHALGQQDQLAVPNVQKGGGGNHKRLIARQVDQCYFVRVGPQHDEDGTVVQPCNGRQGNAVRNPPPVKRYGSGLQPHVLGRPNQCCVVDPRWPGDISPAHLFIVRRQSQYFRYGNQRRQRRIERTRLLLSGIFHQDLPLPQSLARIFSEWIQEKLDDPLLTNLDFRCHRHAGRERCVAVPHIHAFLVDF